jgi:hypothetical protein
VVVAGIGTICEGTLKLLITQSAVPCAKKRTVYSGWESRMERPSQPPLSSLGAEKVTLCLSVGRRGSRPKAKAEDVEPRNSQWERSMPWDGQKTTLDCAIIGEHNLAPRGRRSWHATHKYSV